MRGYTGGRGGFLIKVAQGNFAGDENLLYLNLDGSIHGFVVIQLLSCVRLFANPWTATRQSSLLFTISWSLFKLMSIESVISSHPPSFPSPFVSELALRMM